MKKLSMIIIIIVVFLALAVIIGFIKAAHGSDQDYQICVNTCLLDLPSIEECMVDERSFWNTENTSDLQIKRSCKDLIRYEKIDCQINCATAGIEIEDVAVKYYDTDVKNFPLTNE